MFAFQFNSILERIARTPPIWLAVWIGCFLLAIALAIVSRTKWGQSRPMRKCAVLSVLAHILLIVFAMSFRISGFSTAGSGESTVQVSVVDIEIEFPVPEATENSEETVDSKAPQAEKASGPTDENDEPEKPEEVVEEPVEPTPVEVPEELDSQSHEIQEEADSTDENVVEEIDSREIAPFFPEEILPKELEALPPEPTISESESNTEQLQTVEATPEVQQPLAPVLEPTVTGIEPSLEIASKLGNLSLAQAKESPALPMVSLKQPSALRPVPQINPFHNVTGRAAPKKTASVYRHRSKEVRSSVAVQFGGSEGTENAVNDALAWLAKAQSSDGRWSAIKYGAGYEYQVLGFNRKHAGMRADTGITGLALLAFLGAGHTHENGEYKKEVERGLKFLIKSQAADGNLAGQATHYAKTYCHSMAMFALAEAAAITKDARLKESLRKAVDYTLRAQHHASGGWRYSPGTAGDTSQLGWMVMALRSAERAGVLIPKRTWQGVDRFLFNVAGGRSRGLAAYRPGEKPGRTMTAEAGLCRHVRFASKKKTSGLNANSTQVIQRSDQEAARFILEQPPGMSRSNLYYWYYATLYLHTRRKDNAEAQIAWQKWNDRLKTTLVRQQVSEGQFSGSWPADTVWGGYGGRVYSTAMGALCLEVYYRYADDLEERVAATSPFSGVQEK